VRIVALWAVVVSAGLAVGGSQSTGADPAGSDPTLKAARAWPCGTSRRYPISFVRRSSVVLKLDSRGFQNGHAHLSSFA